MSSNGPSDKMQMTGIVLSWLAGSAVVGMLILFVAFVRSNTTPGTQAYGPLAHFVNGVAPVGSAIAEHPELHKTPEG